jgi:hypothetical protein
VGPPPPPPSSPQPAATMAQAAARTQRAPEVPRRLARAIRSAPADAGFGGLDQDRRGPIREVSPREEMIFGAVRANDIDPLRTQSVVSES